MKKYKTVRGRLIFLMLLFIVGLTFSFLGYTNLENQERMISRQINKTVTSERYIVSIEKQVYSDQIKSVDSSRLIQQDIEALKVLYDTAYITTIKELVGNQSAIISYGEKLELLKTSFEKDDLLNYDYDGLLNDDEIIKAMLVETIVAHGELIKTAFNLIILSMSLILIMIALMGYREIILPLKNITHTFSNQHKQLVMNEIDTIKSENEISVLITEYNKLVKRNNLLLGLNEKINAQHRFDNVFGFIYDNLIEFIPYDRIGIAVVSNDGLSVETLTAKSNRKVLLGRGYDQTIESSSLKQVISNREVRIINDLNSYYRKHPLSDSTRLMLEEGMNSSITLPLFIENKVIGVVFFSSTEPYVYNEEHQQFLINIANALSTSLEKSFIFEDLMISTVRGFAKIVESKDNITGNHIDRISHYSVFIAKLLEEDYDDVDDIFIRSIKRLSPLHDIGKVGIPDHILNKPGKLTDEEMVIMRTHSIHGAEVLEELLVSIGTTEFKMAVDIAKYHHEKVNGQGYPLGLKDDEIPLSARIVALVDVFDALTSERPYKRAFSFKEAIEIIRNDSGTHFDYKLVEYLLHNLADFEMLYKNLWTS